MMDDETINRTIHEFLGKCWHELGPKVLDPSDKSRTGRVCPHCRRFFRDEQIPNKPDYCSDLNAIREAELKVVESKGATVYSENLVAQWAEADRQYLDIAVIATADARTRCLAVLKAIEGM